MDAYIPATCFKSLYLLHLMCNIKFKMHFTLALESLPESNTAESKAEFAQQSLALCFYIRYVYFNPGFSD